MSKEKGGEGMCAPVNYPVFEAFREHLDKDLLELHCKNILSYQDILLLQVIRLLRSIDGNTERV